MEKTENMSKRKMSNGGKAANMTAAPSALALVAGPVPCGDYCEAVMKAAKGNTVAMELVRRAFDEKPQRWRIMGDLASHARRLLAEASAGKDNLPQIEASLRMMADKEAEIVQPDSSPLEKLLAARIAITWFEMSHMDGTMAYNTSAGVNAQALEVLDARRDRADRRFRHAIRDLATVRRLLRPGSAVQVNAGVAQVNVGGSVPVSPE
jgi:hypothetical protein